jgi:hypothetical protein
MAQRKLGEAQVPRPGSRAFRSSPGSGTQEASQMALAGASNQRRLDFTRTGRAARLTVRRGP